MKDKPFFSRSFVSLLMAFCFLGLALSGIVLYFAPPCSVAERTNWVVMTLSKDQWASLHQVLALFVLILATIHLFIFNWKPFISYFRKRRRLRKQIKGSETVTSKAHKIIISREFLLAILVAIIIYLGAILLIPPFGWLHKGSEEIRDQYRQEAPAGTGRGEGYGTRDGYRTGDRSRSLERSVPQQETP